ncbi:MAG: sigma-70 family RNA polymerase sigma factor [Planctomycetes bacterium]|nr:sigma-70 family RNA polymerase sigma factor [Planctomycetota bacterium]
MASPHNEEFDVVSVVSRAVHGDADSLSNLLAHFGPLVEQQLQIGRIWQSQIDTGDVMQVTYLEAFIEIGTFRPEQAGAFEGWLRRIAENNLRDAIRGLERQKQMPASRRVDFTPNSEDSYVGLYEQIAATTTTASQVAIKKDTQRLMQAAIDRLPPDYALTVRLYDLEGQSIGEVSKAIGRSAGAVHMLRARAHERLGELLGTASAWFDSRA